MMRSKSLLILFGLAVVLGLIWFISHRVERSRETLASGPIFKNADWSGATEIVMVAGEDSVRLAKSGESWRVTTEGDYPADTAAVRSLLDKSKLFDRRHLHSSNPASQATFEVDDASGTEVWIKSSQGDLAHFRVGKNGPDFRSQYIRPAGSNEVYLIPDYLKSVLDPGRIWRDRSILVFDREKVASLTFHPAESEPYTVEKQADGYLIAGPDSLKAKPAPIESAVRTLSALRADAFPDDPVPDLASAGLQPPKSHVEVRLSDGGYHVINIGNEATPGRVFIASGENATIYLLSQGRASGLVPALESVKE